MKIYLTKEDFTKMNFLIFGKYLKNDYAAYYFLFKGGRSIRLRKKFIKMEWWIMKLICYDYQTF